LKILTLRNIPAIVYHGSTTEHIKSLEQIKVDYGRKDLDFGQGFYTTSVRKQAVEWAIGKVYGKYKHGFRMKKNNVNNK